MHAFHECSLKILLLTKFWLLQKIHGSLDHCSRSHTHTHARTRTLSLSLSLSI
jgi:hypothetical protein